jgi:hypothetical protein
MWSNLLLLLLLMLLLMLLMRRCGVLEDGSRAVHRTLKFELQARESPILKSSGCILRRNRHWQMLVSVHPLLLPCDELSQLIADRIGFFPQQNRSLLHVSQSDLRVCNKTVHHRQPAEMSDQSLWSTLGRRIAHLHNVQVRAAAAAAAAAAAGGGRVDLMPVMLGIAGSTSSATANLSRVIVIAIGGGGFKASSLDVTKNRLCCKLNSSILSCRTRESDAASLLLASSCCSSKASNFPARTCLFSLLRSCPMLFFKSSAQARYSATVAASSRNCC